MECDGEKQEGREGEGGTAGRRERVEAEPKVYAWPTKKEKLSTSVFSFIETRIFLVGKITKAMEDILNDEKTTRGKKLNSTIIKLEETGPINNRVVLLSTLSYRSSRRLEEQFKNFH